MIAHYKLNVIIGLLVLFFISPANAAWYQVEIIVFEHLSPSADGELWYENPGLPDRSNSIELIAELAESQEAPLDMALTGQKFETIQQKSIELIPYLQLGEENLRLEGIQRVLKLSREYRPLMHIAWQQPSLTPTSTRAVHIQKFEEPETQIEDLLPQKPEDLAVMPNATNITDDAYQVLELIFDGTIRVRSSKFLHVDVDIAYFPKFLLEETVRTNDSDSLFVSQHADYVRLQESRKIKLNEIHYFDHPIFGAILRVSRLKIN